MNPFADVSVVELRQYTLHPGTRDAFAALFDRELVESQEAYGLRVVGQFRDLDDPDRFVWLRGFPDMESRRLALEAFYYGPVWAAHRDAANAMMIDSDDVLLLRPLAPLPSDPRTGDELSVLVVPLPDDVAGFAARTEPALAAVGSALVGVLETEASANTFPRLPVREGERVLVRLGLGPVSDALLDALAPDRLQALRLACNPRSRLGANPSRYIVDKR